MAHSPSAFSDGVSTADVSTDAGVTWTTEWTETAIVDGFTPGLVVDLASYAGSASAEIRFYCCGTYAHAWAIDNVVVDDGVGGGLTLAVNGSCPGPVTIDVGGATPCAIVGIAYAAVTGPNVMQAGPCQGTAFDLVGAAKLAFRAADANGDVSVARDAPASVCGAIFVQAVDTVTCEVTGVVAF